MDVYLLGCELLFFTNPANVVLASSTQASAHVSQLRKHAGLLRT